MTGPIVLRARDLSRRFAVVCALLSWLFDASFARADCPTPTEASPALAQMAAAERLQFLQAGLERADRRATIWSWSWKIGYLGLAGGAVGLAQLTDDHNQRIDLYFGAGKSVAGMLNQFLTPLDTGAPVVAVAGDPCLALAAVETAALRAADDEARIYDWRWHAVLVGFNLALGLVEGFAYDNIWTLATIGIATGIAIGEVEIWTQPTDAVDLRRHYLAADLGQPPAAAAAARPRITLLPWGTGLALTATF